MKLLFLSVGRIKSEPLRTVFSEYIQRISRYCPVSCESVRESRAKVPEITREEEGERLLRLITERDTLVLLDERGKMMPCLSYARWYSN